MVLWTWAAGTELDGISSTGPLDSKPLIHFREFDNQMNRVSKRDDGDDSGDVDADRAALEASLSDEHTKTVVLRDTSVAPHDFSLTPNHYVIVENRLGGDTLPYILGTKCPAEWNLRAISECSCIWCLVYDLANRTDAKETDRKRLTIHQWLHGRLLAQAQARARARARWNSLPLRGPVRMWRVGL